MAEGVTMSPEGVTMFSVAPSASEDHPSLQNIITTTVDHHIRKIWGHVLKSHGMPKFKGFQTHSEELARELYHLFQHDFIKPLLTVVENLDAARQELLAEKRKGFHHPSFSCCEAIQTSPESCATKVVPALCSVSSQATPEVMERFTHIARKDIHLIQVSAPAVIPPVEPAPLLPEVPPPAPTAEPAINTGEAQEDGAARGAAEASLEDLTKDLRAQGFCDEKA